MLQCTSINCSTLECVTLQCVTSVHCTVQALCKYNSEPVVAVLELFSAASPPDRGPVEDVEEEEEHREDDEEGEVGHLKHIFVTFIIQPGH